MNITAKSYFLLLYYLKPDGKKFPLIDDNYFPIVDLQNLYCLFAKHEECFIRHKSSLCLKEHFNLTTQVLSRQNISESPAVDNWYFS